MRNVPRERPTGQRGIVPVDAVAVSPFGVQVPLASGFTISAQVESTSFRSRMLELIPAGTSVGVCVASFSVDTRETMNLSPSFAMEAYD